jgi:pilus assembly protein Flp/PilA
MRTLVNRAKSFSKQEKGATMIEYALVVGLIAVVCIGVVTTFGTNLSNAFTSLSTALTGAVNGGRF